MRRFVTAILIATSVAAAAPALADSAVRSADARVAETRSQLVKANRTGDVATIADARSKFVAAKAVAWGARHPAPTPANAAIAQR